MKVLMRQKSSLLIVKLISLRGAVGEPKKINFREDLL